MPAGGFPLGLAAGIINRLDYLSNVIFLVIVAELFLIM